MLHECHTLSRAAELVKDWARQRHYYYVYILSDADGNIFYVGKGSQDRFRQHVKRYGQYWVSFYAFCFFEEESIALENQAILMGRELGWSLTNILPNDPFTLEQRQLAQHRSNSPENRERKSQKAKAQWEARRSEMVSAIKQKCSTPEFSNTMKEVVAALPDGEMARRTIVGNRKRSHDH